jgi:hydroxypyruvate reductase
VKEAIIVNIARGSVVDETALVETLVARKPAGAGLVVFENAQHVPEGPFALDTVVLTPQIGSMAHATRTAMGRLMPDNLAAHFSDKPLITPAFQAGRIGS